MLKLTLRVDAGGAHLLGPGKVRLLEAIERTGSISAAGRALGMSYRRAWLLVDELNRLFRERVVATQHGGPRGGGAGLTPFGRRLIDLYRDMERTAQAAAAAQLRALEAALADPPGADAEAEAREGGG